MTFNDIDEIKKAGFVGFIKMGELFLDSSILPNCNGVYLVLNHENRKGEFLTTGSGGHFKGKDPNVTGANNAVRPLQVVRLERVADDTIFCVCEGIISEIDVIQPAETVHFGISTPPAAVAGRAKGVIDIKNMGGKTTSANFASSFIAKPLTVHLIINWNLST